MQLQNVVAFLALAFAALSAAAPVADPLAEISMSSYIQRCSFRS